MPLLFFDAVCMGSPVIIILFLQEKLANKYTKILNYRVGTIAHRKVLKEAEVVHDIESQ